MPAAPSIPDAEWEVHKEVIGRLYQDKPLREVMALMEQEHSFVAKRTQYVRRLKYWKFSKYATGASETWQYVAQKLEKRKQEGKDSETYHNGKLVPIKKVRNEISRYPLSSYYYGASDTASSPQQPPGVEVCTPLGGGWSTRFVDYLHIPWFEFEVLIRPHAEFMWREDHQQHNAFATWDSSSLPGHLDIYGINSLTSHMPVHEQQWSLHNIEGTYQTDFALNFSDSMQHLDPLIEAADEPQISPTPQSSKEEARSTFAEIIGDPYASRGEDVISTITSRLDGFLPERQNGELVRSVKRIFDLSSIADASLQLLRYAVFLSSNNLLQSSQIDKLLKWMMKMHQSSLIERLIRIKTPTVEIFLSHLLISATRLQEIDIVLAVLAHGVDVNAPQGGILTQHLVH